MAKNIRNLWEGSSKLGKVSFWNLVLFPRKAPSSTTRFIITSTRTYSKSRRVNHLRETMKYTFLFPITKLASMRAQPLVEAKRVYIVRGADKMVMPLSGERTHQWLCGKIDFDKRVMILKFLESTKLWRRNFKSEIQVKGLFMPTNSAASGRDVSVALNNHTSIELPYVVCRTAMTMAATLELKSSLNVYWLVWDAARTVEYHCRGFFVFPCIFVFSLQNRTSAFQPHYLY